MLAAASEFDALARVAAVTGESADDDTERAAAEREGDQGARRPRRSQDVGPRSSCLRAYQRQRDALPLRFCHQAEGRRVHRQVQGTPRRRRKHAEACFGVDFDRVFATVVKALTIRLVLAIAAARDYNLSSLDIRQAYLQAALDEDLYMRAPPGVNNRGGELVCKLRRSLYGLKQAGREWAQLLSSFLVSWGFVRSTIDVCLYTYEKDGTVLWALVYVCLLYTSPSPRDS